MGMVKTQGVPERTCLHAFRYPVTGFAVIAGMRVFIRNRIIAGSSGFFNQQRADKKLV